MTPKKFQYFLYYVKIMVLKKKQFCEYCPEDKCLLDCRICNPKKVKDCNCDY